MPICEALYRARAAPTSSLSADAGGACAELAHAPGNHLFLRVSSTSGRQRPSGRNRGPYSEPQPGWRLHSKFVAVSGYHLRVLRHFVSRYTSCDPHSDAGALDHATRTQIRQLPQRPSLCGIDSGGYFSLPLSQELNFRTTSIGLSVCATAFELHLHTFRSRWLRRCRGQRTPSHAHQQRIGQWQVSRVHLLAIGVRRHTRRKVPSHSHVHRKVTVVAHFAPTNPEQSVLGPMAA
jgi:hypothetical protein